MRSVVTLVAMCRWTNMFLRTRTARNVTWRRENIQLSYQFLTSIICCYFIRYWLQLFKGLPLNCHNNQRILSTKLRQYHYRISLQNQQREVAARYRLTKGSQLCRVVVQIHPCVSTVAFLLHCSAVENSHRSKSICVVAVAHTRGCYLYTVHCTGNHCCSLT